MDVWIVSAILIVALSLLVSEKLPVDLTAVGIVVALMITGILTPVEAVSGFANPAVLTVGAMFVISRAMMRTGAVEYLADKVVALSAGSPAKGMVIVLLTVGLLSAFINNTPVVVLFIPVVMRMCCAFGLSPSKFLIPVSYASILAGACTLIGTSTNIIISDLSAAAGQGPLEMFELAKVGLPTAAVGLATIFLLAPRLLPDLLNPACEIEDPDHRRFLAELLVTPGSALVDRPADHACETDHPEIEVIELYRDDHVLYPTRDRPVVQAGDLLLVKGSANGLVDILHNGTTELPRSEEGIAFGPGEKNSVVVELIIPPESNLLGSKLSETEFFKSPDIHVIAIKRSGLHYTEQRIPDVRLKTGDICLFWCSFETLERIRGGSDYIIVEDVHHRIIHRRKAGRAAAIFAALVLAASTGLAGILVCALAAAFLMILTGCLQMRDAYRSLQGNVLLLIAGTIALGAAMEKTGASRIYADAFLGLLDGFSPVWILAGVIVLTSLATQILSNNATAVLLLPIAVSAAAGLGVDARPFVIGVCMGASACFATPIGYQTNLLVYGPGGYRFTDYLKLGIPLNLIVIVFGTLLIPVFWPF